MQLDAAAVGELHAGRLPRFRRAQSGSLDPVSSGVTPFGREVVAKLNELGIDQSKVNVNGGAVALGHAIGSSGGRVLTTLLYALKRRNKRRGIATLCLGGGNGVALAVETV